MQAFRAFTADDAVAVASTALSQAWNGEVRLEEARNLGKDTRRNLVLRAFAVSAAGARRSVIIKATRADDYDFRNVGIYQNFGVAREWAAGTYLARHVRANRFSAPLLACDMEQGVLVFGDLGDGLSSLVTPLLSGTADQAERALTAYAEALGALHGATLGCRQAHAAIVREGFPAALIPPPAHNWLEDVARAAHAQLGGAFPEDEANFIFERLRQPGPWEALVHGDACPDNVVLAEDGRAVLIDFEFARPGHALLDAAYWRMGFPTCWCAGMVPIEVGRRIDRVYRDAIADAAPCAGDDEAFERERAVIDFAWLLGNLAWRLPGALAEDGVWGQATVRSRILAYLDRSILSAEEADLLPRLRALADAWRTDLRRRWPETAALAAFPAFSRRGA